MPEQVAKVVQETDWATVAKAAINADPLKFVIIALIVLVMFFGYIIAKFIDAKFISKHVKEVVTAAGGVQNSNQIAIESNERLARDLEKKLNAHAEAVAKDRQETREEIARLRRELNDKLDKEINDFKVAIGRLADGNRSTGEAIARYQARMEVVEANFEKILTGLRKKQGQSNE